MSELVNSPELRRRSASRTRSTPATPSTSAARSPRPGRPVVGETIAEQFDQAAANLMTALRAAGGGPDDLVSLQMFVTSVAEYRDSLPELGASGAGTSAAATRRWGCSA